MIEQLQAIILGSVQGLTEFIPVSSSGHLILLSNLFRDSSNVHLLVQSLDIGTVLALIIFFRGHIADLCKQAFVKHDYRLLRNIIVTCLPVATIGLIFSKLIENSSFFVNSTVIAIMLALVGLLMIVIDKLPHLSKVHSPSKLSWQRSFLIGLAQTFALVPGVSRSGSTIIAAKLCGLDNKDAAEYSFTVSIPVMLGLVGKLIISDGKFMLHSWQPILLGNIAAFIVGIIAIKYLLHYLSKHGLSAFGWYRIGLAGVIITLVLVGIL